MENLHNSLRIHIEISEEHIKNGKPYNSQECPTALALNEALQPMFSQFEVRSHVGIGNITVELRDTEWRRVMVYSGDIFDELFRFIEKFDAFRGAVPFAFDLTLTKV